MRFHNITRQLTRDDLLQTLKPIETRYNGYRFRSRTEARWAVLFDALEIKFEYEKEGYSLTPDLHYLPDFYYHIPHDEGQNYGQWLEIKGAKSERKDLTKLILLSIMTKTYSNLVVGPPWNFKRFISMECGENKWWDDSDECISHLMLIYPSLIKDEVPIFQLFWQFFVDDMDRIALIIPAIEKSKSARFEFGEQG